MSQPMSRMTLMFLLLLVVLASLRPQRRLPWLSLARLQSIRVSRSGGLIGKADGVLASLEKSQTEGLKCPETEIGICRNVLQSSSMTRSLAGCVITTSTRSTT